MVPDVRTGKCDYQGMANEMTDELSREMAAMTGLAYVTRVSLRAPSGNLICIAETASYQRVDCSEYSAALASIDGLIALGFRRGMTVDRPSACAAVWSVPDGAPLEMALDNVGCELPVAAAEQMERWAAERRATVRAFKRGPR